MQDLLKAQPDGEIDPDGQQAVDQDISPEDRVQKADNCRHLGFSGSGGMDAVDACPERLARV
ncbi:hypothetical protein [Paracoccus pantotrophus]|uniref:hypothetical protein n=1 Tax=Paracoccus pantotrophus TaxID=82367 RepID=UPI001AD6B176|nr:hypothetical protein [Paracoccus pantotrophus]